MRALFAVAIFMGLMLLVQCRKTEKLCGCAPPFTSGYKLTYGDSLFYLKSKDYTVSPLMKGVGTYTVFPDNLQFDKTTGAITVTQKGTDGESQTGMWYKIKFKSTDGSQTDSTLVLISGLTYVDKFYSLSQNDSIIYPIYNGDPLKGVPQGNYDLTADAKFAINAVNGQINIKECLRRGFFSSGVMGTGWKVATVKYAIKDNSEQAPNKIDLVLYYYRSINEVPSNVSALMQAHQQMTLGLRSLPGIPSTNGAIENNLPSELSLSKPRPPCVIIVD
jgi:hypothetical protein